MAPGANGGTNSTMMPRTPSFAVIVKAHAWDDFIHRQLQRFAARVQNGRVFLLVDETNGQLGEIPWQDVIRTNTREAVLLGLADRSERNSLFWWNTDYQNAIFYSRHPDYDYYVFAEYDSLIQCDIDALVRDIASRSIDFVAMPIRGHMKDWMWTKFHCLTYRPQEIRASLNCISILSGRAVDRLYQERLLLSAESAKGGVAFWPLHEVFLATEARMSGLTFETLAAFGSVEGYEWFPPYLEESLATRPDLTFVHPVLDRKRYIGSLLRYERNLLSYHNPGSRLRTELARFDRADYQPLLWRAFWGRTGLLLLERWQSLGCRLRLRLRTEKHLRQAPDDVRPVAAPTRPPGH